MGDDAACNELCQFVHGFVIRSAEAQLGQNLRSKVNPSDVAQATLARMVHGFADFRSTSPAEFYAWLNAIIRNEVRSTRRDLHRKRRDVRRESPMAEPSGPSLPARTSKSPSMVLMTSESIERFHQVLQRLPPDYAEVIQLRGIAELSFSEVAEKMNRSVDAVTKLWSRALVKLQQELERSESMEQ
jgi:RNA polymerase sigma-70 factor, ECF subfamily